MPSPGKNESRKEFIKRCIPIVMEEGGAHNTPKKAAGKCFGIWRTHLKKISKK